MTTNRAVLFMGLVAIAAAVTACGGGVSTAGVNSKEYFVITDGYSWQYTNPAYGDVYEWWAEGSQERNGEDVYVFSWKFADTQTLAEDENAATPELIFQETYWQKEDDGVFFRGCGAVAGNHDDTAWDEIFYERPLLFAGVDLMAGDVEETYSDDEHWISTYVEMVPEFDTDYSTFENVLHIEFVDEAGTSPFGGDYYLAKSTGVVAFTTAAHPDETWSLKKMVN